MNDRDDLIGFIEELLESHGSRPALDADCQVETIHLLRDVLDYLKFSDSIALRGTETRLH